MKRYADIFFDLDNTIWNFTESSIYSLRKIYEEYNLSKYFATVDEFITTYKQINEQLWQKYRKGEIKKESLAITRFLYTLETKAEVSVKLAEKLSLSYLAHLTDKPFLEPNAYTTIKTLYERGYRIHIISDGFLEVQLLKIKVANLSKFIGQLITSEEVGVLKPDPKIFEYALNKANAQKESAIFVGDDFQNDIVGAYNFGIDQVFYNKQKLDINSLNPKPTYVIEDLIELTKIMV